MPRSRLGPSDRPTAWTPFEPFNACFIAAPSRTDRRFHALFDKLARSDVMCRAWVDVATNQGAPGVDGVSIDDIEAGEIVGAGFLDGLVGQFRTGTYRPRPLRRVHIPKPGKPGQTRAARDSRCG